MRGSVTSRSKGSWQVTYDEPRGPDGNRRQKTFTVRGTRKEAERGLAQKLNELDQGKFGDASKVTLADFLEKWLTDYVDVNLAPTSALHYRQGCTKHIIPALGRIRLSQLRGDMVQQYLAQKRAEGLDPNTIRLHYLYLHSAIKRAIT